jgi:hypothetical protein
MVLYPLSRAKSGAQAIRIAFRFPVTCTLGLLLAVTAPCALSAAAGQPAPKSQASLHKAGTHARKGTLAVKVQAQLQPAPAPVQPEAPKPPDWPVNDQPKPATVEWNSKGLRIDATNSSLQQILKEVATATGTQISGATKDQRIFGTYGPGPAREVISQLLQGSGYNVLMIGDQGQGTPRQVVLSGKPTGPAPQVAYNPNQGGDDDNSADVEEPPQPQPQTQPESEPPPPPSNGFGPGSQPRTPQQILQEMQQRQQQIEQMQRNANQPNQ